MAKQQTNIWVYVIIALIVGILIGYAAAGGFAGAGQATKRGGTVDVGSTKECSCDGQTTLCPSNQACDTCCSSGTGTPI